MDAISTEILTGILIGLIFCSAFFSSSETSMLALNRYRLKHLVKKGNNSAKRAADLLSRPDRLIGVILIGNNLVNIFATIVAGVITTRILGEWATVTLLPVVLTLVILIFAEVTPKSVAAVYPEKIAFPASLILRPLLWVLYPVVWSVNIVSNGLAKLLGLDTSQGKLSDNLLPEELRTVVDEAGELIPEQHQGMLLNILDLEEATVEDIMVPRNEIIGIDLEDDIDDIMTSILTAEFTRLPVYDGDINEIIGVLHLRHMARFIKDGKNALTHEDVRKYISPPYFVPESTSLPTQLLNFQKERRRMAIVVDEYGDVQGIATVVDLLEEIVGEFRSHDEETTRQEIVESGRQGWFEIDASASVREINRNLGWHISTSGPKTLNGIIVEFLESIPDALVSFEIGDYRFELISIGDTRIEKALVTRLS